MQGNTVLFRKFQFSGFGHCVPLCVTVLSLFVTFCHFLSLFDLRSVLVAADRSTPSYTLERGTMGNSHAAVFVRWEYNAVDIVASFTQDSSNATDTWVCPVKMFSVACMYRTQCSCSPSNADVGAQSTSPARDAWLPLPNLFKRMLFTIRPNKRSLSRRRRLLLPRRDGKP